MNREQREQLREQLDAAAAAIREARQLVRVANERLDDERNDGPDPE